MPEPQTCNFIKYEALAQVLYSEFCEVSKNTFFTEDLWTTASKFVTEMLIFRSSRSHSDNKVAYILLQNAYGGCF